MTYQCEDCGRLFTEDEAENGFTGMHLDGYREECIVCPNCKCTELNEIALCKRCGAAIDAGRLFCGDCLRRSITVDRAERYGAGQRDSVSINSLYAAVFSASQIEAILWREMMAAVKTESLFGNTETADSIADFCLGDWGEYERFLDKDGEI